MMTLTLACQMTRACQVRWMVMALAGEAFGFSRPMVGGWPRNRRSRLWKFDDENVGRETRRAPRVALTGFPLRTSRARSFDSFFLSVQVPLSSSRMDQSTLIRVNAVSSQLHGYRFSNTLCEAGVQIELEGPFRSQIGTTTYTLGGIQRTRYAACPSIR